MTPQPSLFRENVVTRTEYRCADCAHLFRTENGVAASRASLMCPACGSPDLFIEVVERPQPQVMRARAPLAGARPEPTGEQFEGMPGAPQERS